MSRILIEATPLELLDRDSDFRHLYLVFEDDQGVETVITAAPDENGPLDFDNLEVGGRDPADVCAVMLQQAQNIDHASLDYQPLGDNSNTVIKVGAARGRHRRRRQPAQRRGPRRGRRPRQPAGFQDDADRHLR